MARAYIKTNPSRSRKAVPPPPPARPQIKLNNNWSNIDTDDGNHPCKCYIEGAAKFQQVAIEKFTKERDKFKNQKHRNMYHQLDLVIETIKKLKLK